MGIILKAKCQEKGYRNVELSDSQSGKHDMPVERCPPGPSTAPPEQQLAYFLISEVLRETDDCGLELLVSRREPSFSQNCSETSQRLRIVLVTVVGSSDLNRSGQSP